MRQGCNYTSYLVRGCFISIFFTPKTAGFFYFHISSSDSSFLNFPSSPTAVFPADANAAIILAFSSVCFPPSRNTINFISFAINLITELLSWANPRSSLKPWSVVYYLTQGTVHNQGNSSEFDARSERQNQVIRKYVLSFKAT